MAEDTKPPLASVPMFNIPSPDVSKVNPAGITSDPEIRAEYQKYLDSIKQYSDALEQRYAQPNWFKVAAGFAKPQLGGFLASLGSASQAMGEQTELSRAVAPTVAQMRSEIARGTLALTQRGKAAKTIESSLGAGRIPTPEEATSATLLTKGPEEAAQVGQGIASAQTQQLAQAISSGLSYAELVSKFGKDFVNKTTPILLSTIPGLKPPAGAPQSIISSQVEEKTAAPVIPGVSPKSVETLPLARQIEAGAKNVQAEQDTRDELVKNLTTQATQATPIFETAKSLYNLASNPNLAPAFGVFSGGDPMSIIGKALESGSFPNVVADMRKYIVQARLGADKEKRAMSDLQTMENLLKDLQVKLQAGIVNPTDIRSLSESKSIPGAENTQDAFLRGIARIASEALGRYETNIAFGQALKRPDFSVREWGSSPEFTKVQENAQRRANAVIANKASQTLPEFMKKGLIGAYQAKETTGDQSKNAISKKASAFEEEARRRGLIK